MVWYHSEVKISFIFLNISAEVITDRAQMKDDADQYGCLMRETYSGFEVSRHTDRAIYVSSDQTGPCGLL